MIDRTCLYCGTQFQTFPSIIKLGRGKYCSRRCSVRHHAGLPIPKRYESGSRKQTFTCPVCGASFQRAPSEIEGKNELFCSYACSGQRHHERAQKEYECSQCGKKFVESVKRDLIIGDDKVFCSVRCREDGTKSWDIHFFDELTPESAYVLGFILADGHLRKEGGAIIITQKSPVILARVARAVRHDGHLKVPGLGRVCHDLILYSRYAVNVLSKEYGVPVGAKSLVVRMPKIEADLYPHLIRGLFDGDGCAVMNGTFSFCSGSSSMLTDFNQIVTQYGGLSDGHKDKKISIHWGSWENTRKFAKYIYGPDLKVWGSDLYLSRKKERLERAFTPWVIRGHYTVVEAAQEAGVDARHIRAWLQLNGRSSSNGKDGKMYESDIMFLASSRELLAKIYQDALVRRAGSVRDKNREAYKKRRKEPTRVHEKALFRRVAVALHGHIGEYTPLEIRHFIYRELGIAVAGAVIRRALLLVGARYKGKTRHGVWIIPSFDADKIIKRKYVLE